MEEVPKGSERPLLGPFDSQVLDSKYINKNINPTRIPSGTYRNDVHLSTSAPDTHGISAFPHISTETPNLFYNTC
jgi:hypothetical protein